MSVASPNALPARGMAAPNNKASHLLAYMKLRAPSDPIVHEKISKWVALQKLPTHIHPTKVPTCRASSVLLLQRLVRAFENRQSSSSDDAKRSNVPTSIANRSNPSLPTNGNFVPQMSAPRFPPAKKITKSLNELMQRKVKVTQLVQRAVQFVGSDVLKVLQVSSNSPTVADVANACLMILNDESRIKEFYRIFSLASGKDPSQIDAAVSIFFGVFALQALQSLRAQAISAYEFSHDFEMIYRTCYQDQNFQICMHELNPAMRSLAGVTPTAFAPDTEARNICWKLARLLTLKYDNESKSDPEAKDHRRNHILLSATSIILAANIGKSIKNAAKDSAQKGTIPNLVDFVDLVAAPVSDLLKFLMKNTAQNQGITPIYTSDIRTNITKVCILIDKQGIGGPSTNGAASPSSNSLLANLFSPEKHYILINDYRNVIQTLVTETQKELKINTAVTNQGSSSGANVRTGIVNVLLFFPMVIGEPWGIHRDAPMITSKMLCSGENSKPSEPLKDSVAVVLKMKTIPKVIKRKAAAIGGTSIPNSIRTDNKKAKSTAVGESPKKMIISTSEDLVDLVGKVSPSPAPKAPIHVRVGEIEAPTINDSSELNEWTVSVLSLSIVKPTDALLTYLGEIDRNRGDGSSSLEDVIVPVLNRGVLRIQSAIRSASNLGSEVMSTKVSVGKRDGQVYVNGVVDKNIQLCAAIVGFYYYSLEAIIQDQMDRMDLLGSLSSQLRSGSFHRALLACCYSCILKGVGMNQKLQVVKMNENITVQVLMDITESESFTLLKVIEAFSRALIATKESIQKQIRSPIVAGLPSLLHKHAQKIEAQLIDSALWTTSTTSEVSEKTCFTLAIKTMKSLPGAWPPDILEPMLPEEIADVEGTSKKSNEVRYKPSFGSSSEANFLSFVLRKLLKRIFFRTRAICAALNLSNEGALHTQILVAFRYLLRHHISIFNDRHVDQLLLCTIYGVCRVMKIHPRISFEKVIDAYFTVREEDQGDRACRIIVRHVKLASSGSRNRPNPLAVGNVVVFYNTVYIPKMQKYFLGSKSLKKAAESYQITREREEKLKEKQKSQKKNAAEKVPKKPLISGATAVATTAVATESLQSTNSQMASEGVKSGDKKSAPNGAGDIPSVSTNGSNANPITEDLTNKTTFLDSAGKTPGANGASVGVSKPSTTSGASLTPGISVTENGTTNGQKSSAEEGDIVAEKGNAWGKTSSVVLNENSNSTGTANVSEKSNANAMSQGLNKPITSSTEEEVSSSAAKPSLIDATKPSEDLVTTLKESIAAVSAIDPKKVLQDPTAETDGKKEKNSSLPNGTVNAEGSTDNLQKKGPETAGKNNTGATASS